MDELTTFSRKLLISILASLRPPENARKEADGTSSPKTDESPDTKRDARGTDEEGGSR